MLSAQRMDRLRGYLIEEQAKFHEELANRAATMQEVNVGLGNHMADDATAAFDQATAVSFQRGHQIALRQVEQALRRMEAGEYGICDRCRDEIDFARLKAVPHAALCMSCQKLAEF